LQGIKISASFKRRRACHRPMMRRDGNDQEDVAFLDAVRTDVWTNSVEAFSGMLPWNCPPTS
jgi:hypothetical protein